MIGGLAQEVRTNLEEDGELQIEVSPKHKDFGRLTISVGTNEATVFLGHFTHIHFQTTSESNAKDVAEDLGEWLTDLFEDRILCYQTPTGGGCKYLEPGETPTVQQTEFEYFLWSGPLNE